MGEGRDWWEGNEPGTQRGCIVVTLVAFAVLIVVFVIIGLGALVFPG